MSDSTPKIYAAIAAVQAAVAKDGIGKDRRNEQQGYKFRGIDDIYNAVAPLLAANGLCIMPSYTNRTKEERTTQKGGVLFYVTVEGTFDFVSTADGSKHTVKMFGEAMDSGDKATNKAMSAAYKYACLQTFCIPTEGDNDADTTTHEVLPQSSHPTQPVEHPTIKPPLTVATANTRAAALDRLGCQEDGPQKTAFHSYLVALGWLEPDKSVEQWPARCVPLNKDELEAIRIGLDEFSKTGVAIQPYAPHGLDPAKLPSKPVEQLKETWASFVMPFGKSKGLALGKMARSELDFYMGSFVVRSTVTVPVDPNFPDGPQVDQPIPAESVSSQKALRAALDEAAAHFAKEKKG